MSKLTEVIDKISQIFSDDGLKTEYGIIHTKELNFKIFNEKDTLVIDFLGSLPEVSVTKNILITNVTVTVKLTRIDFIDNNKIKLYFDGFPWHKVVDYD